jgi:hypothetical protein
LGSELAIDYVQSGKIKLVNQEFEKLKKIGEDLDKTALQYKNDLMEITHFGIEAETAQQIIEEYNFIKKMNKDLKSDEISKYMIRLDEIESKIKELSYITYQEKMGLSTKIDRNVEYKYLKTIVTSSSNIIGLSVVGFTRYQSLLK